MLGMCREVVSVAKTSVKAKVMFDLDVTSHVKFNIDTKFRQLFIEIEELRSLKLFSP